MDHFQTIAIRGQMDRTAEREHSVPLFPTSSFVFDDAEQMRAAFAGETDANIYSRYSNPNTDELVSKMCLLEGTEAGIATASGMAAVFAGIVSFLRSGDHILASRAVFGSTHQILTQLLPRWGITHTYVSPDEPVSEWGKYLQPTTRMVVLETPSNPGLALLDLAAVGEFCRTHQLIFNIDNCFATPYLQQPARFGADIIVHSATKFIDGQGRVLGGLVLGRADLIEQVRFFTRHTGPAMSPFNAWILSKSLETLAVRMDAHCASALQLAETLATHPDLEKVVYPFLPTHPQYELARRQMKLGGGIVTFEVKGGLKRGKAFLDALQMISRSPNLGDTRTIATHPASTTHSKLTDEERAAVEITPGLVRISVGLEHFGNIIADIDRALEQSRSAL